MRIIKQILGFAVRDPKPVPCGHVPPLFLTTTGKRVTITMMPQEFGGSGGCVYFIPASVWCDNGCGWVNVTTEDYEYYRSFDGNAKA